MDDAAKPVKHNMEKVAQLQVINVLFYLGETTGIHNFGLSLQRLPNAEQENAVFCHAAVFWQ